jgi:eukaryotic-like serine/threonine-protein kinase
MHASNMSFHVGEDIGEYRIVSILGAGSMGHVFQVEHRATQRKQAMKVLLAHAVSDSQFLRFMREIEVQGRLQHPNIARVHSALHFKNSLVLLMESVEGRSLEKLLQTGRLPIRSGIDYIRQTLCGLEYAHLQGVVHRDVTPGNLIVTPDGRVKLTDFGLAKSLGDYQLTSDGDIVGSLYYMPPEQIRRQTEPDPRSDIYSAGAVLYELLTGKKLFDLTDRLSLMLAQVQKQPVPPLDLAPEIPPELNAIVLKALSKDPEQRFQSAGEFRWALERIGDAARFKPGIASRMRIGTLVLAACAMAEPGGVDKVPPPAPVVAKVQTVSSAPVEISLPAPPKKRKAHAGMPTAAVQAPIPEPAERVSETAVEPEKAPLEEPAEDVSEPIAEPRPQPMVEKKKHFWNKLNFFKRHQADRSR